MSIDGVLKLTLGLFVKKSRRALCRNMEDGSLSSQKLRSSIINNLEDLKKKFEDSVRKDLLTSASNLQEGLRFLNALLDQPHTSTLPLQSAQSNVTRNPQQASYGGRDSPLDVDSALELREEIKRMNSTDHFKSAMNLFEKANTKATEAFHNKALNLEDQVWATKLRVQSRLLLSLENPSLAKGPCILYLEELHGLSPVVDTFRNHLEGVWLGKMLSFLTKEKRQELVFTVSLINIIIFKFLKRFTTAPLTLYDWPNLAGSGWTYNPLIPGRAIHVELQSAGIELPYLVVFEDLHLVQSVKSFAVKSDGDLVVGTVDTQNNVDVDKIATQTNETVSLIQTDSASVTITTQHLLFLAIDSVDNMYLLTDRDCTHSGAVSVVPRLCELFAFDSKGDETHHCEVGSCRSNKAIASTPDGFVMVRYNVDKSTCDVEFYKNSEKKVQRISTFQVKLWENLLVAVTKNYQVIAVEERGCSVRVYEKDGQLVREFELHGGKNESCVSIAFNHLTGEVVFVTSVGSAYYLSTYVPETGERRHCTRLTLFGKNEGKKIRTSFISLFSEELTTWVDKTPRLTSHCAGPMALVSSEYVLYIQ